MGLTDFYIVSVEKKDYLMTMVRNRLEIDQSNKDFYLYLFKTCSIELYLRHSAQKCSRY